MSKEIPGFAICRRIASITENTINFLRVAPQWHLPGVILGAFGAGMGYKAVELLQEGRVMEALAPVAVSAGSAYCGSISVGVAYEYFTDYQKMKRMMSSRGWNERIVAQEVEYYCGKRAAMIAATDTGYKNEFNNYLKARGLQ